MARSRTSNGSDKSSASLGFEAKLWLAADKLCNNMDAAEYTLATLRATLLPKLLSGEVLMKPINH